MGFTKMRFILLTVFIKFIWSDIAHHLDHHSFMNEHAQHLSIMQHYHITEHLKHLLHNCVSLAAGELEKEEACYQIIFDSDYFWT